MSKLTKSLRPFAKTNFHLLKFGSRTSPTSHNPEDWPGLLGMQRRIPTRTPLVAIGELGGDLYSQDVQSLVSRIGTSSPNIQNYSVAGGSQSPGAADGEVALDVQVVLGVSYALIGRFANIAMIWAPNTDTGMIQATQKMGSLGADAGSWSWGSLEANWSSSSVSSIDSVLQTNITQGCDVTAASGDNDSGDGGSGNNVDFMASSPYCIGCGGTTTLVQGSTINQSVWNDGTSGTGGGQSRLFNLPPFQSGFLNALMRGVPDIAGPADPATGWMTYVQGVLQAIGGTSAVAPFIATVIACAKACGYKPPSGGTIVRLYSLPTTSFYDVTQGNNGAFSATTGYDMCTGRGVPSASFMDDLISGTTGTTPVDPNPPTPTGATLIGAQAAAISGMERYASAIQFPLFSNLVRRCEPVVKNSLAQYWASLGETAMLQRVDIGTIQTIVTDLQSFLQWLSTILPTLPTATQAKVMMCRTMLAHEAGQNAINWGNVIKILQTILQILGPVLAGGATPMAKMHAAAPVTQATIDADLSAVANAYNQLQTDKTNSATANAAAATAAATVASDLTTLQTATAQAQADFAALLAQFPSS